MSQHVHALIGVAVVLGSAVAPLAAQHRLCLRAQPKPDCAAFLLTNAGSYVMLGRSSGGATPFRGVLDYGFMVNVNTRDAIGASVFASLDRDGFAAGPAIRYRRWLTPSASLEVAVGKSVAGNPSLQTGAVFGLVKWSPNHWFALAARPEIVRQPVCGPTTCDYQSRGRLSFGAEAGAVPGLVITGVTSAVFLAFLALLSGYSGD